MTKKLLGLVLVVLFGFTAGICLAKYTGGDGSPANPYRIYNAYDMNDIGLHEEDWGSHFVMVNDVNLAQFTGTEFNVIGSNSTTSFTGVFDGNGHNIYGFSYTYTGEGNKGLFGVVNEPNAIIKELTLIEPNIVVDGETTLSGIQIGSLVGFLKAGTVAHCYVKKVNVSGKSFVGGLVGLSYDDGIIVDCQVTGNVRGSDAAIGGLVGANTNLALSCSASGYVQGGGIAGGLVGWNFSGTISDCYSTGMVDGNDSIGGLVGHNAFGEIMNCYATGIVDGNKYTGGLVGYIRDSSTISNCYATGAVDGNTYTGGLVGVDYGSVISNCYAAGAVTGNEPNTGGLVGYDSSGTYTKSFWDSDINPDVNGIGNITDPNVIGKSTAEMQKESTFTDWDFVEVWNIGENQTYPFLRVYPAGDLNHDGRVDGRDLAIMATRWLDGI